MTQRDLTRRMLGLVSDLNMIVSHRSLVMEILIPVSWGTAWLVRSNCLQLWFVYWFVLLVIILLMPYHNAKFLTYRIPHLDILGHIWTLALNLSVCSSYTGFSACSEYVYMYLLGHLTFYHFIKTGTCQILDVLS